MRGKVGIVTGGASGIGRAIVGRLLRDGARVLAVDISPDSLADLEREFTGGALHTEVADITAPATAEQIVQRAATSIGCLDYLVNAAGIVQAPVPLHELSFEQFTKVQSVNLAGTFLFYRAAVAEMVRNGTPGSIVNIASTAGIRPVPRAGAYAASKYGVVGLTLSAALEVASHGIRVNVICPGVTDTPLYRANVTTGPAGEMQKAIPLRRLATTDEIANAVVWLLGNEASYVTGATLQVDGGLQLI